jgi:hypothetical protein
VELAPEKAASTAENAATYFDGMLSQKSDDWFAAAFAAHIRDQIF